MRKLILVLLIVPLFTHPILTNGQQLNVENVFNSALDNNTKQGINAAYMFHHVMDENFEVDQSVKDLLFSQDYDVLRFPGGAIGNYYRQNGTGYGAIKSEVQNVENTVTCNGNGFYCFQKDQDAPRNFVYDFLDLLTDKYNATNKDTEVLYMLNLLLHFVYNYSEIPELDAIADLDELEDALIAGDISQNFYDRIIENYTAMELIINHPNANIQGIEMGNEFYFYVEVTGFPYKPTNSNPFFNPTQALNQIEPRMQRYLSLIKFYKRIVQPLVPDIKVAVPTGGINHFGNMTNVDELWNTAVRNWILQDVDAIIPHFYIKTSGDDVDPLVVAQNDDDADLLDLKERFLYDLETKFVNSIGEIVEFYGLDQDFKELWITEFNVNKNESQTQFWDEWTNTFFHGAFLAEWMKKMSASAYSDYITYGILHAWTGGEVSYEHCNTTKLNNGDLIRRIGDYVNASVDFLKSSNTRNLSANITSSQDAQELYTDAYYSFSIDDQTSCAIETLYISYTNLRSDIINTTFNFPNNQLTINGRTYDVLSARFKGFAGLNVASSCGETPFNEDESVYDITEVDVAVNIGSTVQLPAYASGYVEIIIEPENNDCLPLSDFLYESEGFAIQIFPNPTTNLLRMTLPGQVEDIAHDVLITNAMGQLVKQVRLNNGDNTISVKSLPRGTYFLQLSDGNSVSRSVPFNKL